MCLSESTFLSLSKHFQKNISALGYPRFFKFFQGYFQTIYSIESAKWLYLFSDYPSETTWKRIVFIGKDRNGELRRRWQVISEEELIFIDMYPGSMNDLVMDDRPTHSGTKTMDDHSSRITRDSLGRFENASLVRRCRYPYRRLPAHTTRTLWYKTAQKGNHSASPEPGHPLP